MDPRRWLRVAERLAKEDDEELWRTSMGRSYYAFFHVACSFLERCGFRVPDSERAHAYVWMRLQNCDEPVLIDVGTELDNQRTLRNIADYKLGATFSQRTAARCVERATAGIDTLDELLTDDAVRTRATETIRRYERNVLRDVTWRGDPAANGEA